MKKIRRPIEEILQGSNQAADNGHARGLKCPKCSCVQFASPGKRSVRNTVPVDGAVRRYRECRACGHVWATYEH
jgi:hypothetical protein